MVMVKRWESDGEKNGDFKGVQCDLMGFYGDLMGFDGDLFKIYDNLMEYGEDIWQGNVTQLSN